MIEFAIKGTIAIGVAAVFAFATHRASKRNWRWSGIAAFAPLAILIASICLLAVNVPYWDDYDAIVHYMAMPFTERFRHILDFHNEHRIATVRLSLEAMAGIYGRIDFKVCMVLGTMQLAVILALFRIFYIRQFGRRLGVLLLAFAGWHICSMLNFDNAFWALTAIENFGVLMWAFLAIAFFHRRRGLTDGILSSLCAVAAILTSAQGLAVVGAISLMSVPGVCDHGDGSGTWQALLRRIGRSLGCPTEAFRLVFVIFLSILAVFLYFRGFAPSAEPHMAISASFCNKLLYVLAFVGNLVPLYPIALAFGIVVVIAVSYIAFSFPRIPARMHPVFFFMVYLIGVAVAGVFFRASEPMAALSFRYYIITACLFVSIAGLLLSIPGRVSSFAGKIVPMLVFGFCALDVAVLLVGYPMFRDRNEALRHNILVWPRNIEGLRVDNGKHAAAASDLSRLEELGLYDHKSLLRKGEAPPESVRPWPQPHFP